MRKFAYWFGESMMLGALIVSVLSLLGVVVYAFWQADLAMKVITLVFVGAGLLVAVVRLTSTFIGRFFSGPRENPWFEPVWLKSNNEHKNER